ncbi:8638_t:CDS:2, partial [Racocetra persica]
NTSKKTAGAENGTTPALRLITDAAPVISETGVRQIKQTGQ